MILNVESIKYLPRFFRVTGKRAEILKLQYSELRLGESKRYSKWTLRNYKHGSVF